MTFKIGDRVRYKLKPDGPKHWYSTKNIWQDHNTEHYPMIDTTKKLFVQKGRLATFITFTSEGHILVGLENGWVIFDTDGQFVRSNDGSGGGLTLFNEPQERVIYQPIAKISNPYIMSSRYLSQREAASNGSDVVKVTSRDGKVVSVELV